MSKTKSQKKIVTDDTTDEKNDLINNYKIKDMKDWNDLNCDLIITDPPFGIEFDGKNLNYNRDVGNVVDGYVEWEKKRYRDKIKELLKVINKNLNDTGQGLIFSGWNNSNCIHNSVSEFDGLKLEGKLYWSYNFAPYCKRRPAHNIYEIYWLVKGDDWTYKIDRTLLLILTYNLKRFLNYLPNDLNDD